MSTPTTTEAPLVKMLVEALQANGVFHTPIALRRRGGQWDEYELDAIRRTRDALGTAPTQPETSLPEDKLQRYHDALTVIADLGEGAPPGEALSRLSYVVRLAKAALKKHD